MAPGLDDAQLAPGVGPPHEWVAALAYLKAAAAARTLGDRTDPVVGSDTTCVVDGAIAGTPESAGEARRMIRSFVGKTHEVLTGVAIVCPATGRRDLFVERAEVTLGVLDDGQIDDYVESGAWKGKAGGYNYTERKAAGWPLSCRGSENTIVGLPVEPLLERLRAWRRA